MLRKMLLIWALAGGAFMTEPAWAELSGLPDPEPYLASDNAARQNTILKVKDFSFDGKMYEQPCFEVGQNKALYVRKIIGRNVIGADQNPSIYIDGKEVLTFMWWGAYQVDKQKVNAGYPFSDIDGNKGKLVKIDPKAGIVVFNKPYIAPDNSTRIFSYTLKALPDSKIELSWDLGVSQQEMDKMPKQYGVGIWMKLNNYRGTEIIVGDKKFVESDNQTLIDKKKVTTFPLRGDFIYGNEAQGFKLLLDPALASITETVHVPQDGTARYTLMYKQNGITKGTGGKVVIDFGQAVVTKKKYPAVGGIDFWRNDNIHVPVSPVRNLMPNPSFEQGLRYWTWCGGGARFTLGEGPHYKIVPKGYFGRNALQLENIQLSSSKLKSFPIALDKGTVYTLSFYAKADKECALVVSLTSAAHGGKFNSLYGNNTAFNITPEWKRYSQTFTADAAGLRVLISGSNNTLIDGLQLEKGDKPTDFVTVPLEGNFTTSDPDNFIVKGSAIDAGFVFSGKPGTQGKVNVIVKNAYGENIITNILDVKIPETGHLKVQLPLDEKTIGEGIFLVQADFHTGDKNYTEYYRFSVMNPLSNTHATKDIVGTLDNSIARIGRGEDFACKLMQWGFGSTSWGIEENKLWGEKLRAPLEKKYRIANYFTPIISWQSPHGNLLKDSRNWKEITPELEKHIEQIAYDRVSIADPQQYNTWAFRNEDESAYLPDNDKFDEYFKAQSAAARGAKKANPKALFAPTSGTSGYSLLRGYRTIEGYLKTSKKHNFRYDAICVHPYGNIDKGTLSCNDLDEETARLIDQMKRYGYGKETSIYYTEMFNATATYIPEWNAGESYDSYTSGKPTYDFGNREFIHAASLARLWIIALKYWPQLRSTNVWISSPYMDYYLTPLLMCKVANTIGNFMPDVQFYGDIKPAANIRGYSFTLKDGSAIAALWCIDRDVENGLRKGPEVAVKFQQPVEFYDMMGNRRLVTADKNGITSIQLTPMPLLIKAKDVAMLTNSLRNIISDDIRTTLKVSIQPSSNGEINAIVKNQTDREQNGVIEIVGKRIDYKLDPEQKQIFPIPGQLVPVKFGTVFNWKHEIEIESDTGAKLTKSWNMDFFYVPQINGTPDWKKIPAIPITNRHMEKDKFDNNFKAKYQVAYDRQNLYLRVEIEKPELLIKKDLLEKPAQLWQIDGCLEMYLDTGADGLSNEFRGYDKNDYRYDFSTNNPEGKTGRGRVWRMVDVDPQLADGLNFPTKAEVAEKVKCQFIRTEKGFIYEITLAQRYLEPFVLKPGNMAGFGLVIHNKKDSSHLTTASEKGAHCYIRPDLWPIMILK